MRDRAGIACAGLLLAICGASCGPGLEPPGDNDSAPLVPVGTDDGQSEGQDPPDAATETDEGLDAGVENDHTNDDDPGS